MTSLAFRLRVLERLLLGHLRVCQPISPILLDDSLSANQLSPDIAPLVGIEQIVLRVSLPQDQNPPGASCASLSCQLKDGRTPRVPSGSSEETAKGEEASRARSLEKAHPEFPAGKNKRSGSDRTACKDLFVSRELIVLSPASKGGTAERPSPSPARVLPV